MKIGIIGAMNEEVALFKQDVETVRTDMRAGMEFIEGKMHGVDVVITKCGVGKVNAAVCTQILIERYGVDNILFTGVAGALDPKLTIGDIVISTDCMQHDMDATPLGFSLGEIPYQEQSVFVANPNLMELAMSTGNELFPGKVLKGRILSGDQFIASRDKVRQLHEQLKGACTEMEGAAVAQVCTMYNVPFVIIRSMSDQADGSADVNFAEFTLLASENSYQMVKGIIQKL